MSRIAVLGGAGGIGRMLVGELIAEGHSVLVLDLPSSLARHDTPGAQSLAVDAADPASWDALAPKLPDQLDGFVNLCGFMAESMPVTDTDPAIWDSVIAGNLTSAFHGARCIAPRLSDGAGMVLTGSGLGHFARPGYGPYAVAKAGIAMMTKQLALELAPRVRVNAVAPSAVDTAFLRGGTGRSDEDAPTRFDIEAYGAAIPLGRIATPGDVTGPIRFLLSDAAGYITGQVLHVNGGGYMP